MAEPSGFQIQPASTDKLWQEQAEIVVGLRATTAGRQGISGFRVVYSISGRDYTDVYEQAIWLCAPASSMSVQGCAP